MDKNTYVNAGYEDRNDYISKTAEDFGIPGYEAAMIAEILGEDEDFDGLVSSLEDYAEYSDRYWHYLYY